MLMRGARLNAIQLAATIVDVEVNVSPLPHRPRRKFLDGVTPHVAL